MYALVDANNFYVSCERLFKPHLAFHPVVVLSNNDGCVVSRSNEAKVLGIKMSQPFYQLKDLCHKYKVVAFSSNFTLYGDLSARMMALMEEECHDVEIYSIDEAFLSFTNTPLADLEARAYALHQKIKQYIGIPTTIGIAPTKTLAKAAGHIAKKHLYTPLLSLAEPPHFREYLPHIPVGDVWGIGRRLVPQLEALGIRTAWDLQKCDPSWIRKRYSVMMERTVRELQGIPCLTMEAPEPKQGILSSQSFATKQNDYEPISQALSTYCMRASTKLWAQKSVAGYVHVFLRTSPFLPPRERYSAQIGMTLSFPSQDVRVITQAAHKCLKEIFKKGYPYQKVGVFLGDISSKDIVQGNLFTAAKDHRAEKLMECIDHLNKKYGTHTIHLASASPKKDTISASLNRSPSYTTKWGHIPEVG